VLDTAEAGTPLGVRNRAILEVLYSSGMRRMELMGLKLHDLDTVRGVVTVRQGKGRMDRFIPLGERACGKRQPKALLTRKFRPPRRAATAGSP